MITSPGQGQSHSPIQPEGAPLRILHIAAPTAAGGAESVIQSLAIGHSRRGHEVSVAALVSPDGEATPFVQTLGSNDVTVHSVEAANRRYLHERRSVATLCDTLAPEIVHMHGYRIELTDRDVVARRGVATVTTLHGATAIGVGGLKGRVFERLQRLNHRLFDGVVVVSKPLYEATVAAGVPAQRVHHIPNARAAVDGPALTRAESRRALGLGDDRAVIGWVGRLFPVKGADVFIEAVGRIPAPRPVAAMIGYGPEMSRLRAQASALGLEDDIRFYPEIRDAGRYFAAFDAYVLSSRSEGLPIVLLEAMAAGAPIVATRVGGVADVIGERGGWMVPAEQPSALAEAIQAALVDRDEAALRTAEAGRRLASHFSIDLFLDRYEAVYRQAVARRKATS